MIRFCKLVKAFLLSLYAVTSVAPFWTPLQPYASWLQLAVMVLITIHLIEFLLLPVLREKPKQHMIPTLLYGFGHWLPLRTKKTT
ncbi:hypothetical protein [Thalassotalea agarivorans]|uniref:DUF1145 domain-containing protein n=1 Tax=Thalassotalea agarivorans TaxID=349064 RepID=A0A1I0EQN4_THASX|nr:hypothetical protein [Thalassotalea agarivorans]SET47810.1 hypothetical protein SAMN05660429_01904 [Thalassotalea agarivorans]